MLLIKHRHGLRRAVRILREGQTPVGDDGDGFVGETEGLQGTEYVLEWSMTVRETKGA